MNGRAIALVAAGTVLSFVALVWLVARDQRRANARFLAQCAEADYDARALSVLADRQRPHGGRRADADHPAGGSLTRLDASR